MCRDGSYSGRAASGRARIMAAIMGAADESVSLAASTGGVGQDRGAHAGEHSAQEMDGDALVARVIEPRSVSVVITTYNHARYLGAAIGSIAAQTVAPFEVIVVDDGSADYPEKVTRQYSHVRLIRQENQGLPAARNTGWRAASGRYVVFLDADDRLLPKALQANLERFAAQPECGFVYGAYRTVEAGHPITNAPLRSVGREPYVTLLKDNVIAMHGTVMYRRDRLEEIGGFDPSLRACEDYDVYLRLARSFPVACGPECIAEYHHHSSNMSHDFPKNVSRGAGGSTQTGNWPAW